jgi:hypothetical protein
MIKSFLQSMQFLYYMVVPFNLGSCYTIMYILMMLALPWVICNLITLLVFGQGHLLLDVFSTGFLGAVLLTWNTQKFIKTISNDEKS